MRRTRALSLALLALCAPGCGGSSDARAKNLLLVCVDTLRADQLGALGASPSLTPALDRLAARSVVFERAHSAASWTLPSVGATFTSLVPSTTRLWNAESRLGDDFTTLPELFQRAGFDTAGIASHEYFKEQYGLLQGFDAFDAELAHKKDEAGWKEVTSPEVSAKAVDWLARRARGNDRDPWLLFLHFFDPHLPYVDHDGTAGGRSEFERYQSEIRFTDGYVGAVLDALEANGFGDDTVVLFFSDHGESFQEHPPIQRHSFGLYEEELRVPLFLCVPGVPARRVSAFVRSVDLLPTLLELFGLGDPEKELREGQSLVALCLGRELAGAAQLAEIRLKDASHKNALVSGRHKLIENVDQGTFELYDLGNDARERHDLAREQPELLARLQAELRAALAAAEAKGARFGASASVPHTPEELEHLRELGYGGEAEPEPGAETPRYETPK